MSAAELAETVRDHLDGEYTETAFLSARLGELGEVLVTVEDAETSERKTFAAVLVEVADGDTVSDFGAGRAHMLREVLAEAEEFEAAMRRRRYFNNANGVRRFVAHLKARLAEGSAQ
ncbi:hypothetical protein ACFWDN_21280 [Micromonospora chalcea]